MRFGSKERGFTLIEMLVVISMILILLSIALPMYNQAIQHSRETRLHHDLKILNDAIDRYGLDKGHAPQSPDDLVQAGYVKFIPDDITGRTDTWDWRAEDPQNAWDPSNTGIGSVHSGGEGYKEWDH